MFIDSMGSMYTYQQFTEKSINKESWSIVRWALVDLLLLIIIMLAILLDKSENERKDCKNPVREWIIFLFVLYFLKSVVALISIAIMYNCYKHT